MRSTDDYVFQWGHEQTHQKRKYLQQNIKILTTPESRVQHATSSLTELWQRAPDYESKKRVQEETPNLQVWRYSKCEEIGKHRRVTPALVIFQILMNDINNRNFTTHHTKEQHILIPFDEGRLPLPPNLHKDIPKFSQKVNHYHSPNYTLRAFWICGTWSR